jgi:hypothetical protein
MSRVNITLPDDVCDRARAAGLNSSRLAREAITDELDRRAKANALDSHLSQLEAELGPVSEGECKAAEEWADRVLGPLSHERSA